MRRNVPTRAGKPYFLFVWVALGFILLVAASLAWRRSATSIVTSNVLHHVGPDSPAGPSTLVDLHAEIEVLRNQRDLAQTQAKQLLEQLSEIKKKVPETTDLQRTSVSSAALPDAISEDRHVPWVPSEARDQKSSNPELAAILRCAAASLMTCSSFTPRKVERAGTPNKKRQQYWSAVTTKIPQMTQPSYSESITQQCYCSNALVVARSLCSRIAGCRPTVCFSNWRYCRKTLH